MEFSFTAKSRTGITETGTLVAETLADAQSRLREQGLFPLSIDVSSKRSEAKAIRLPFNRSGVRKSDILMLTSQLSIMCQAGIDVAEALGTIAERCPNPTLAGILREIHGDVSAGLAVSEALHKHTKVFGSAYVASIAAGESSGTLTGVLHRLAELLKHEIQLRSTISSMLAYPIVLSGVACLVIAALVFFVLPQFSEVFASLGTEPPLHTQLLLLSGSFLRNHFLALLCSVGVLLALSWRYLMTEKMARYCPEFPAEPISNTGTAYRTNVSTARHDAAKRNSSAGGTATVPVVSTKPGLPRPVRLNGRQRCQWRHPLCGTG